MNATSPTTIVCSTGRAGLGVAGAKILLGLLVALVPAKFPLLIGVDETIERRRGAKISAKGCYRDAVRSTRKHVVRCFGLKWLSLQLLVVLPWSQRAWGLPFFTVLTSFGVG